MYTVPFGRLYEPYMEYDGIDDGSEPLRCCGCGREIEENTDYYYLSDSECYCMNCEDDAIKAIGEKHAEEYKDNYQP